jgi:hypothetical protein
MRVTRAPAFSDRRLQRCPVRPSHSFVLARTSAASAQHPGGHSAPTSPYAGLEMRQVKALSDEQVADLRAGRGTGLALRAELNGYPGPVHVLELAERLELTAEQRSRVQELYVAMKAETIPLGERPIAQEADLDRLFDKQRVTSRNLQVATKANGTTQGALRAAHLRYHLSTSNILRPHQVQRYKELRGYADRHAGNHH